MKSRGKKVKNKETGLRKEIFYSLLNSFKIEGIHISEPKALESLKKVELSLGK